MDKDTELDFLVTFARLERMGERGYDSAFLLRCLWTAFCLHHDLKVGSQEYLKILSQLWEHVYESKKNWYGFADFANFMCFYMVQGGEVQ